MLNNTGQPATTSRRFQTPSSGVLAGVHRPFGTPNIVHEGGNQQLGIGAKLRC
ncbi:hypothetical protein [Streptomyces virginiae]|uniref:hypothetical protein n=1 Tax=Streptomyces virginiae TaxID=1961 RepID=UPI003321A738